MTEFRPACRPLSGGQTSRARRHSACTAADTHSRLARGPAPQCKSPYPQVHSRTALKARVLLGPSRTGQPQPHRCATLPKPALHTASPCIARRTKPAQRCRPIQAHAGALHRAGCSRPLHAPPPCSTTRAALLRAQPHWLLTRSPVPAWPLQSSQSQQCWRPPAA